MSTTPRLRSAQRVIVFVSLPAVLGLLNSPQELFAREQSIPVTVLVFNYSTASPSTLKIAEQQVSQIFREADMQLSWISCPVPLTVDSDQACAAEIGLQNLRVRIVDHPEHSYFGKDTFGFSLAPAIATVYYGRALGVGIRDKANYEPPLILGCAMAHEIGHLLLGQGAHAPTGIMQAQWKRKHLELAMRGQLLFTAEEGERMRSNAGSRLSQPTAMAQTNFGLRLSGNAGR